MSNSKIELANREIRHVTNVGIVINVILTALKVVVGIAVGSIALIADGVHSLSDLATDLVLLLGVYFGSKQADESHPYGHGRMETLAGTFIGAALAIVGAGMIYQAGADIAAGKTVHPNFLVLIIASASVVAKEILYRMTKVVAISSHSSALYANAWHHRSDALSSVAVVIGFMALEFGFRYGDQLAAVVVGLMIVLVAIRILGDCLREFTESAIDVDTIEHIKQIVNSNSQIHQWHQLRTRMVGREVFLDLHILVDPKLDIAAAHEISENLERVIEAEMTRPMNIIVHVEPDIPALRR